jgi:hypothetical protein
MTVLQFLPYPRPLPPMYTQFHPRLPDPPKNRQRVTAPKWKNPASSRESFCFSNYQVPNTNYRTIYESTLTPFLPAATKKSATLCLQACRRNPTKKQSGWLSGEAAFSSPVNQTATVISSTVTTIGDDFSGSACAPALRASSVLIVLACLASVGPAAPQDRRWTSSERYWFSAGVLRARGGGLQVLWRFLC